MSLAGLLGTVIYSHVSAFIRQVTFLLFMPWETDLHIRYTPPHSEIGKDHIHWKISAIGRGTPVRF